MGLNLSPHVRRIAHVAAEIAGHVGTVYNVGKHLWGAAQAAAPLVAALL